MRTTIKSREELQTFLENIMGSRRVYFQPPETLKINYPCIIYEIERVRNQYANNDIYLQDYFYKLILVDSNPDSEYFKKLCKTPECRFVNYYVSENLNHFVFQIYIN